MPLHESLIGREFGYDDILLVLNNLPGFERHEVGLSSNLTRKVVLDVPFVSSPMDTVTGGKMAVAMAALGGIGAIHYNYRTLEEQIEEVRSVKIWESAFITNPVTLPPTATIRDVYALKERYGFFTAPIVDNNGRLLGIVKKSDVLYAEDRFPEGMNTNVTHKLVWTPRERLVVAHRKDTLDKTGEDGRRNVDEGIKEANRILRGVGTSRKPIETLPIVDDNDRLVALVTDRDLRKDKEFPYATKDGNKHLMVFAAVESRLGLARQRIRELRAADCDGIVIDAGVVFREQLEIARHCKEQTGMDVVVGSIDSGRMLEQVVSEAGDFVDAFRVGVGPGMSCTTQKDLGVGRAQGSAVYDCAQKAGELEQKYGRRIPIIADGGIRNAGDIVKALALGADTVMMGGMLAGLEESPGQPELTDGGFLVKRFRGMGSVEAMGIRSADRYAIDGAQIRISEGITMAVGYKGSAYAFIPTLAAAARQSMLKQGFRNIPEMQAGAEIVPRYLR